MKIEAFGRDCGELCRQAIAEPVEACGPGTYSSFGSSGGALEREDSSGQGGVGGFAAETQLYVAGLAPVGELEGHAGLRALLVRESALLTTSDCLDDPQEVVEAVIHVEMNSEGKVVTVGPSTLDPEMLERGAVGAPTTDEVAACFADMVKAELSLPRHVVEQHAAFGISVRAPHVLVDVKGPGYLSRGTFW